MQCKFLKMHNFKWLLKCSNFINYAIFLLHYLS